MLRWMTGLALGCLALAGSPAVAQERSAAAGPEIWRLDCGNIHVSDLNEFSDAFLYTGQTKDLVGSCYLIRHGDRYLLWDTGLAGDTVGRTVEDPPYRMTLSARIVTQLERIGVRPERIEPLAGLARLFELIRTRPR